MLSSIKAHKQTMWATTSKLLTIFFVLLISNVFVTLLILCKLNSHHQNGEPNHLPSKRYQNAISEIELSIYDKLLFYKFQPQDELETMRIKVGGNPKRNLIISNFRSGSSFISGLVYSVPGTYFVMEPFLKYGNTRIRDEYLASERVNELHEIMMCNDQISNTRDLWVKTRAYRPWADLCSTYSEWCFDTKFGMDLCKMHPFLAAKINRLPLHYAAQILDKSNMDYRVLYLVRDPRATLASRRQIHWCKFENDCSNPLQFCNDLVQEFKDAMHFKKRYPQRFKIVRYEDVMANIPKATDDILSFFQLEFGPDVHQYLNTHTKHNSNIAEYNPYTLYRNSSTTAFHWLTDLPFEDIQSIQHQCGEALKLWGYKTITNRTNLSMFNPVADFVIDTIEETQLDSYSFVNYVN